VLDQEGVVSVDLTGGPHVVTPRDERWTTAQSTGSD
jgi:hypothetical protein